MWLAITILYMLHLDILMAKKAFFLKETNSQEIMKLY